MLSHHQSLSRRCQSLQPATWLTWFQTGHQLRPFLKPQPPKARDATDTAAIQHLSAPYTCHFYENLYLTLILCVKSLNFQ